MAKMSSPNAKQYLSSLKNGSLSQIYILLGEEESEKQKFIEKICSIKFSDNYDKSIFRAENDEFLSFIDYSSSSMMFSPCKAAIFINADKAIKTKEEKSIFSEFISNIPDDTLVFMTISSNSAPKYLSGDLIQPVIFWKPFESELKNYIIKSLKDRNINIAPSDADTIIRLTGRSVGKIDKAIERLSLSGEQTISSETIIKNISDEKSINIFEFIDALFLKQKNILDLFLKVKEGDVHELVIISFIKKECEKFEKYFSAQKNGFSSADALSKAGIYSKSQPRFLKSVSMFDYNKICTIQQHIYLTELKLKSSSYKNDLSNPMIDLISEIVT